MQDSFNTIGNKQCTPTLSVSIYWSKDVECNTDHDSVKPPIYTTGDKLCTPTLFVPYSYIGDIQWAYTVCSL